MGFWFKHGTSLETSDQKGNSALADNGYQETYGPMGRGYEAIWTKLILIPIPENQWLTPGTLMDATVRLKNIRQFLDSGTRFMADTLIEYFTACVRCGYGCLFSN